MTTQTAAVTPEKKMTIAQKKAWVISKLDASQRNVELALLAIYNRQTLQEQNAHTTVEDNGIGFTGTDGEFGTSLAKAIIKYGKLTPRQAEFARKIIGKYWRQLIEVAEAKGTMPKTTARAPKSEGISIDTVTTDGLVVKAPAQTMAPAVNTAPETSQTGPVVLAGQLELTSLGFNPNPQHFGYPHTDTSSNLHDYSNE
jgi:hypothetical protein